jgi:diacylglycerol kinase family enzyme
MSTVPATAQGGQATATSGRTAGSRAPRWLARLSLALAVAAIGVLVAFAELKSIAMLGVALAAAAIGVVTGYLFLSRRGVLRWLALALFVLTPLAVIAVFAFLSLLWVAAVAAGAWLLAALTGRLALTAQADRQMPEHKAAPPKHPFLIMNPKSGGGRVAAFDLERRARELGAEVFLLAGPEHVDVADVARTAVAGGADLLGVAGGDGTQAQVAGVAAEHGIPFVVITAGTRNHFGLDLGLDTGDPSTCLAALSDGVELRIDLGEVGGRTFVNNASFGAYAEIVKTPGYRADKLATTLDTLPDLLQGHRGARLEVRAGETRVSAPQAVLIANNPYAVGDIAGLSRRPRLDGGMLGVVGVTVGSATQAVGLLRGGQAAALTVLTAAKVVVIADAPRIPVGVDGEALVLPTPVDCAIRPQALRVRVPRHRPGVPPLGPPVSFARLGRLAFGRAEPTPDDELAHPATAARAELEAAATQPAATQPAQARQAPGRPG